LYKIRSTPTCLWIAQTTMQSRLMLLMAFAAGSMVHSFKNEDWRQALVACTPVGSDVTAASFSALLNHKTKPSVQFHVKEAYTIGIWHFFNVLTAGKNGFDCFQHEKSDRNDCYYEWEEKYCKLACHGHCIWVHDICDPPKDWQNADQRDAGFHQAPCSNSEWPVSDETVIAFSVQDFAPGCHVVGGSFSWEKAEKDSMAAAQQKFIVGPNVGTFGFATISPSVMITVAFGAVVGAMGMRLVGLRVVHARSSSSEEATLLAAQ